MKLPNFLNSLNAILIPMIIVLLAFVIDAGVLFFRAFPDMPYLLKLVAAANLGFGLAFPLLLTSINSRELPKVSFLWKKVGFPELFAVCTAFMIALFFEIVPGGLLVVKIFLSVMLGLIDYLYAYLFVSKYQAEQSETSYEEQYTELESRFSEVRHDLKRTQMNLIESDTSLEKATKELNEYRKQLTCPHCNEQLKRFGSYRNHVNRCPENPKNKDL